jgi:hypothetical protein
MRMGEGEKGSAGEKRSEISRGGLDALEAWRQRLMPSLIRNPSDNVGTQKKMMSTDQTELPQNV